MKKTGTISTWNDDKGFGFISDEFGKRYFLHISKWQSKPLKLSEGMPVEFTAQAGKKGDDAVMVRAQNQNTQNAVQRQHATQQTSGMANPYHFVRLTTKTSVSDTPVWHDGENSADSWSGELNISLKALTPLLVGQWQFKAGQLAVRSVLAPHAGVIDKKSLLEPLRLSDGRVVLPGSSLKGMIRHSLSALLSAPMERVAERSYSYRPNAKLPFDSDNSFRKVRPAIIEEVTEEGEIKIKILKSEESVLFGHFQDLANPTYDKVFKKWDGIFKEVPEEKTTKNGNKITINHNRFTKEQGLPLEDCYLFAHYDGGIDGKGILCKLFNEKSGVYDAVLISSSEYPKTEERRILPEPLVQHYMKTLEHLRVQNGLLGPGYPKGNERDYNQAREKIKEIEHRWRMNRNELVGRLIYVELENTEQDADKFKPDNATITSFGHHYYYRWRYADTIRTHWNAETQNTTVRPMLSPLPSEKKNTNNNQPERLSAARLLFGYTSRDEPDPLKQDGSANIGKKDFQRLAGRIHINGALEQLSDGVQGTDNQRFLDGDKALALQPLGQPRPSAVEHYLLQPAKREKLKEHRKDGGQMLTYGDLPGKDTAPMLAGRKFYLHQPDAAVDPSCYRTTQKDHIEGEQAMLARFVSKPGASFRFSLGFKDLRLWELGALLTVLEPVKHLPAVLNNVIDLKPEHRDKLTALHDKIDAYRQDLHLFAHKLGHARPLGFGSIHLSCDRACTLTADADRQPVIESLSSERIEQALGEFAKKWAEQLSSVDHIIQWCAVHQYAGRSRSAYPRKATTKYPDKKEIFIYHSEARANHIAARRKPETDDGQLSSALLAPLEFNPPK